MSECLFLSESMLNNMPMPNFKRHMKFGQQALAKNAIVKEDKTRRSKRSKQSVIDSFNEEI